LWSFQVVFRLTSPHNLTTRRIIFTSQSNSFSNENYEIKMMNSDGSGKTTVSDDNYWDFYVEWDY